MDSSEPGTINIGELVRNGVRLKTVDVVALLHNACVQLEAAPARQLPSSIDELSINDAGEVMLLPGSQAQPPRAAVTTLLERLLEISSDQPTAVPAALRTLPARLQESGQAKGGDLKDLMTILRWHLPYDSRQLLRDLAVRAQLSRMPDSPAAIDVFAPEPAGAPIPAAAAPRAMTRRVLAYAAAGLIAMATSGYVAYRLTLAGPSTAAVLEAPLPPASRVIVRESPPVRITAPQPILLAVSGGAFSPSFATGRTLLFHAGHTTTGRLFTATLDDRRQPSSLTPLLHDRGRAYHARLSPDGRRVAFDSDRDGVRGVYIADRAGGGAERISGAGFAAVPSWSPDMTAIAFVRAEPGRDRVWNLWARDLATGATTRLTRFRAGQVWGASWFPDSNRFAVSPEDRLLIADRSGRELGSYASPIARRLIRTPAVSPDGSRVVFQVFRDGVWVLDVASGQMRRVLDDATAEEFAWDPEGRHVAFHSRRGGQWRIWVMPV
jgi:Tol biopolymer transport system component